MFDLQMDAGNLNVSGKKLPVKSRTVRHVIVLLVTGMAIFQAGRAIFLSFERQLFLHKQAQVLKEGQKQAEEINKELRDGLSSYRSASGIERLARERLNLAGPDEVILRIGK
ncbi:MAG: hypothetical protein K2Y32_13315 [Candidatus Obscuribacterales bacterium]|nr:hypothetical protein [Candidatus Obscuribacterales bacterium]